MRPNDDRSNSGMIKKKNDVTVHKKPHLDILGYTINIASKMTNFAKPNQIIIGEEVYRNLDTQNKRKFKNLQYWKC